jgi:hypothetical protein
VGEVWVSVNGAEANLFARAPKGDQVAPWVVYGKNCNFILYSGPDRHTEIGRVTVTRDK